MGAWLEVWGMRGGEGEDEREDDRIFRTLDRRGSNRVSAWIRLAFSSFIGAMTRFVLLCRICVCVHVYYPTTKSRRGGLYLGFNTPSLARKRKRTRIQTQNDSHRLDTGPSCHPYTQDSHAHTHIYITHRLAGCKGFLLLVRRSI